MSFYYHLRLFGFAAETKVLKNVPARARTPQARDALGDIYLAQRMIPPPLTSVGAWGHKGLLRSRIRPRGFPRARGWL